MWLTRMVLRNRCGLRLRDSVLRTKGWRLIHRLRAPKTIQSSFLEKWRKWRRKFRFSMQTTSISRSKYLFSLSNAKKTSTRRVWTLRTSPVPLIQLPSLQIICCSEFRVTGVYRCQTWIAVIFSRTLNFISSQTIWTRRCSWSRKI